MCALQRCCTSPPSELPLSFLVQASINNHMAKDYYKTLGIERDANVDAIKAACE